MNKYTFHITLYDLFFFGMIFIGAAFALLLAFVKSINRTANRFLALALLTMILWMMRVLAIDVGLAAYLPGWLPMQFLLALGPLLYFYVLKLTRPAYQFRWKDLLHFTSLLPGQAAQLYPQLYPLLQLLIFISIITYLHYSQKLIHNFYRRLPPVLMDRSRLEFRWLRRLLAATALLWVLWIAYVAVDYFGYRNWLGIHVYYPFYIFFTVIIIWTAMAAFLKPQAGRMIQPPVQKPSPSAELKQKGAWLKRVMEANLYYQDPELSLSSLAEKLKLTIHELSRIINSGLKKSFNDFINEYRVRDVILKMQDPAYDNITLLGIAYESGFNSKATFNRMFRQTTGKSPQEYKAQLKKEVSSYNLRRSLRLATVISYQETTPVWSGKKSNRIYMIRNYIKTAWRSLLRHKTYALVNVTGLTVGTAACLLIFLVIRYQTSFDTFHSKKDRIYRLVSMKTKPTLSYETGVPFPLPGAVQLDFPYLQGVATILRNEGVFFTAGDKKFKEDETYYAEPQVFSTFDFTWLAGDKKSALTEPNTVALSRSEAEKFFGDWHQAMGKTIRYNGKTNLKVTGILEDAPANSDFPLKVVMSYATMRTKGGDNFEAMQSWGLTLGENYCFVTLPERARPQTYEEPLNAFLERYDPVDYKKGTRMQLQPLTAMHFDTRMDIYTARPFSKELINALSLIGLFLMVIACVNFINLATAQAINRSKEVGVRKVLGSSRPQLVFQFMSETGIITLFAITLAAVVTLLTLPFVNHLLEIQLKTSSLISLQVIGFIGVLWVVVTFLSGFYPSLVLSGFNPIAALKNKIASLSPGGVSLRRSLVVLQFCIAQVLIIGTLVMVVQLNFFKNKSLGFNQTAMVTMAIPNDSVSRSRFASLQNELLKQPGIKGVSFSAYSPVDENMWFTGIHYERAPKESDFGVCLKWADANFFTLYQMKFVAGQAYAASDTVTGYVVNETLVKKLGLGNPQQAIGKTIGLWNNKHFDAPITGVVHDFNVSSFKDAVPPILMAAKKSAYSVLNVQLSQSNMEQTLGIIENKWNAAFPDGLYEYHFVDNQIAKFYKAENQLSLLYQVFAGIAIFISCLGLFGLVSFMAVQRTKEVGIRKTLGASVGHIVYLFSKEFTLLVLIAAVISAPVGGYLMNNWLQSYTFRIKLGPGIFISAVMLSIIVAWLTVGYKAVKAALANPVKSLKNE